MATLKITVVNGPTVVAQIGAYRKTVTEKSTLRGLVRVAKKIQREAVNNIPYVPLDLGNLQASMFVTTKDGPITLAGMEDNPGFIGKAAGEMIVRHASVLGRSVALCKQSKSPMVILGHTANYAVVVHEMGIRPPRHINWSKAGSGPKWLEIARNNVIKDARQIMAKELKGGGERLV